MAEDEENVKLQMLPENDDPIAENLNNEPDDLNSNSEFKTEKKARDMFFNDDVRRIDFILAYIPTLNNKEDQEKSEKARKVFEQNLIGEGLELEYCLKNDEVHFVKVHVTLEVLTRYAEILKIRMPMKKSLVSEDMKQKFARLENPVRAVRTRCFEALAYLSNKFWAPFQLDPEIVPHVTRSFTCPYSRDKEYLFEIPDHKEDMFNNVTRSLIVDFILRRKPFSDDTKQTYSFGIKKMLADNHYSAAYPLHEGHWKPGSPPNARKLLYDNWAHWKMFFKFQPHNHIRNYYGEKIGMYFTWLGFYTQMLVPISITGLIIFIYGCAIMNTSYPGNEICNPDLNITMCPLCDVQCPYWKLNESCSHAKASRIFDNGATVFFAIFMSLWGTLFLEFWKRKQAVIQHKWDLIDFVVEEEPPRPEYLAKLSSCKKLKVNRVTGLQEPHVPFWTKRFPIFLMSWSLMFFLAAIAIGAVVGVIAYRVSVLAALNLLDKQAPTNSTLATETTKVIFENASLVTTITAALINLIVIIILNMIYSRLAFWLTDLENLRTQSDYDDSITLKLFSLQFVNYYSSIVYIAFFKGRFVGRPGDYNTLFGARQEECGSGGCLIELCIQLAIIMTGKQLIQNNIVEIVIPKVIKMVKRFLRKETREQKLAKSPWEKDYTLDPAQNTSLFYEYLEMILQFGFLTIFVAAFPLGPIFALLNNLIEIRCDALKFITHLRRPMAERAADIGIWYNVLYSISRIAVVSNAFIIALTSDYIPRMTYLSAYSKDGSMTGYINHSLAYFNTSDFEPDHRPVSSDLVEICRYRDFRNPPWSEEKYAYSEQYWHILAARLAFVVIFENVVVVMTSLIAWLIPDMPAKLKKRIRREAYITNEIVIKTELMRSHGEEVKSETIEALAEEETKKYSATENDENTELIHRKKDKRSYV
ncbi:hypothetical protein ScPMuIL_012635 [Solemya velum]